MRIKQKKSDLIIDGIIYIILLMLCAVTILPFMQVITISMSSSEDVAKYGLHIIPTSFSFEGYSAVLKHELIWTSYQNTIARTIMGTGISLIIVILGAYPLSKKFLPNKQFWTGFVVLTMYFQGGLIPSYMLIRNLGMLDSMWSLILPSAVNAFNLIIVRNFFMAIPGEIEEAAKIDGANEFYILFRIIVPLSLPILATVALWAGVFHWNSWFDCMIYIQSNSQLVLQYVLKRILIDGQTQDISTTAVKVNSDTMKMAALVVATLPIVCTYPFLQKYFVKGIMIGSVKG